MNQTAHFGYTETPSAQILEMRYAGTGIAFDVLLPRALTGLPELEKSLTSENLAGWLGDRPTVEGHEFVAFPRPARLLEATAVPGLNEKKVDWLHGIARAALDGRLDTGALAALPRDEALAAVRVDRLHQGVLEVDRAPPLELL